MKRRSIGLLIGMLLVTLLFAFAACTKPNTPTPTTYTLSETSVSLTVGGEKQLTISPAPKGEVSWESSSTAVATVENGLIVAVGAGSATVSATFEGTENPLTCTVTVTESQGVEPQTGYKFEVSSVSLKTGETFTLKVLDEEDNVVTSVTYSSDDTAIATVSESGLVTAVAAGETTIKAQVEDVTLTCTVTVTQKYTYSLDKTELDIAAGASERITLIVTPEGGTSRPHTFTSSDTSVATVEGGTGKVTGVGKGTAIITCSVDGEELTATVTVTEYTAKINGEAWAENFELRVGESAEITVTADPTREFTAAYASSDTSVVTVENGHLVAVSAGTATVTVTVAGRTFATTVTVRDAIEYFFAEDELTVKLGESGTLTVVSDPASDFEVTFESSNESVATVTWEGAVATVKGVGLGEATVIAKLVGTNKELTATVHVIFGVERSEVEYAAGGNYSVNLDALDETNETIDWIYYGSGNYVERMNGGSLLGEFSGNKATDFYDYRVGMNWTNGTTTQKSLNDRKDGITLKDGSFTVKVTKDVKYISVFTGVYHGTNTITISYNGVVCNSYTFENAGNNDAINKNKQIIFTPDVEHLIGDEMEFTISFVVGPESSNGWADNISLVAVAVVGNNERQEDTRDPAATGSVTITPFSELGGGDIIDLTAVGTLDWVYAKNGDNGGLVRKNTENRLILENEITTSGGDGYDWIGVKRFTWSDGTQTPAGNSVNNFQWINVQYQIPVRLTEGTYEVTLYLSGWKNSYFITVFDENANTIVETTQVVEGDGANSKQAAVKVTLNVTEESTFLFRMTKEGDGNHGWAAIAVGTEGTELPEPEVYTLNHTELTLTIGADAATAQLEVYNEAGEKVEGAHFQSTNVSVADVDETTGLVTARGIGKATIRVTIGASILICEVTVTLPDAQLLELDWAIDDLTRVSSEYKTIAYKHWAANEGTKAMDDANIIGEPEGLSGQFWDYKGALSQGFQEGGRNVGTSYGNVVNGSFTINVTVGNQVSGIVFYTGAYNGNATITFTLGEKELASIAFSAGGDGIARKIVLNLDTTAIPDGETQTLVIAGSVEQTGGGGNVNVVALAVVGKEAQTAVAATGTATRERLGDQGSNLVNLTEEGTYDWIYSQFGGSNPYRKFGGTAFTGETYYNQNGELRDPGNEWDGRSAFKWTDGYLTDTEATEGTANPADDDEVGKWGENALEYTNNYKTSNGEIHIGMHLEAGTYTVKVYLNSWKADLATAIYDGNKNFVVGKVCLSNEPGDGSGWVVTYTLNVAEASDFNLVIGKVRSHGADDRQVGWQAVSVAKI